MGHLGSWVVPNTGCADRGSRAQAGAAGLEAGRRMKGVTVTAAQDWNSQIIAEFRANRGKVGGPFEGATLLLLHTVGAKTGQPRVNPVAYRDIGDGVAVFASKAGAPSNPDWYYNLLASPQVSAEIGTETLPFVARVAE